MSARGAKAGKGAVQAVVGTSKIRLVVEAGKASPAPPVGPALGQKGIKSIDFCKQFNEKTKHIVPGTPLPCVVTVKPDRTFTFAVTTPATSWLLKRAAGIEKGSAEKHKPVAVISLKHVFEIARIKMRDDHLKHHTHRGVCAMVIAQAGACGITVVK